MPTENQIVERYCGALRAFNAMSTPKAHALARFVYVYCYKGPR